MLCNLKNVISDILLSRATIMAETQMQFNIESDRESQSL